MISREQLLKLATLARLRLDETEIEPLQKEIAEMLDYVNTLQEVDTSTIDLSTASTDQTNVLREDIVQPSLPVEEALKNAPERVDNYFKVPKVVDN